MWQGWVNLVLGLLVFVSGLINTLQGLVSLIIYGALIGILGFWSAKKWQGIVMGVIGVWLLISGIFYATLGTQWNYIIFGLITAALGLWAALEKKEEEV